MNATNTNIKQPVWAVYDELRTTRLNVLYYERQVSTLRRNNLVIEVVLALTVSSGVAGLWLWETAAGSIIWKALVTLAAFLAVLKPLIKLSDQIQKKSDLLVKWRVLHVQFRMLRMEIHSNRSYDDQLKAKFRSLLDTEMAIVKDEPLEAVNEKLRAECFQQVKRELPPESFFVPEG